MLPYIFWLVIGLLLIIKCGDWFVDAAVWVAKATKIPSFIIGGTIVSLATTFPELLVSTFATASGNIDLAIGNAFGSVIANLGLIMGLSLTFLPPKSVSKDLINKSLLMIFVTILMFILLSDYTLSIAQSLFLWMVLIGYIILNVISLKKESNEVETSINKKEAYKQLGLFVLGAIGVIIGADLLVDNGSALAVMLNIPQAVIGLTIVAVGTSLPELTTTVLALIKKESGLSLGNIIGANMMNMVLVVPFAVMVAPSDLRVRPETISVDIPFALFFMVLTILPPVIFRRFYRWQGYLLLLSYAIYLIVTII